ncbi:MAG: hypothetical protein QXD11_01485 [Candidatus Micrarchaeaceae archaeon]
MAKKIVNEKPVAAFVLTLVGGILVLLEMLFAGLIAALVEAIIPTFAISSTNIISSGAIGSFIVMFVLTGMIIGSMMIISAIEMYTTDIKTIKKWPIVALVMSVLSVLFGGGFLLGFILGLIGSILGLVYKQ